MADQDPTPGTSKRGRPLLARARNATARMRTVGRDQMASTLDRASRTAVRVPHDLEPVAPTPVGAQLPPPTSRFSAADYLWNWPSDHDGNWTDNLQGITHDETHWLFTQKDRILKFPVGLDLSRRGSGSATATRMMPDSLAKRHGDHFGDPDLVDLHLRGAIIVIPVEGTFSTLEGMVGDEPADALSRIPVLAAFRNDAALTFLSSAPMTQQARSRGGGKAGWCAVHPVTKLLYTSHNSIGPDRPVLRYWVDWDKLAGTGSLELVEADPLPLIDRRGQPYALPQYIQGGTFAPDGTLFLLAGRNNGESERGGIHAFESDGRLVARSWCRKMKRSPWPPWSEIPGIRHSEEEHFFTSHGINWRKPFFYEYGGVDQEPEGLCWWDLDDLPGRHPRLAGQLHAILLNNDLVEKDNIWLKHYRTNSVTPLPSRPTPRPGSPSKDAAPGARNAPQE